MGLSDEAAQVQARRFPGTRCTVLMVLAAMDAADADDLRQALADPTLTSPAIATVLGRRGHQITQSSVARHRRGDCACHRRNP